MSAPKRTKGATDIAEREEWLTTFRKRVTQDATARRAWEMLARAGLETEALRALWTYAHPPTDHVKKAQRNIQYVNRRLKALIRAGRVEGRKAGDRRASMYFDRYWQKHLEVVRSEMPFADHGTTVGDWILSRAAAGKGVPNLPSLRKGLVSLGPRGSMSDRKIWLFVLLCYAENCGVRLRFVRLAALAQCADARFDLDPYTLAHFLAALPARYVKACQRDLRNLAAPPVLPPQD